MVKIALSQQMSLDGESQDMIAAPGRVGSVRRRRRGNDLCACKGGRVGVIR